MVVSILVTTLISLLLFKKPIKQVIFIIISAAIFIFIVVLFSRVLISIYDFAKSSAVSHVPHVVKFAHTSEVSNHVEIVNNSFHDWVQTLKHTKFLLQLSNDWYLFSDLSHPVSDFSIALRFLGFISMVAVSFSLLNFVHHIVFQLLKSVLERHNFGSGFTLIFFVVFMLS